MFGNDNKALLTWLGLCHSCLSAPALTLPSPSHLHHGPHKLHRLLICNQCSYISCRHRGVLCQIIGYLMVFLRYRGFLCQFIWLPVFDPAVFDPILCCLLSAFCIRLLDPLSASFVELKTYILSLCCSWVPHLNLIVRPFSQYREFIFSSLFPLLLFKYILLNSCLINKCFCFVLFLLYSDERWEEKTLGSVLQRRLVLWLWCVGCGGG